MDRRSALVSCLVVALIASGCSAPQTGSTGTGSPRVTPAPVPTTADSGSTLAPGLTGNGIVDAAALVAAHERLLANRSYTVRTNLTERFASGRVRRHKEVKARYGSAEGVSVVTGAFAGSALPAAPNRTHLWSNGQRSAQEIIDDGETTAFATNASGEELLDPRTRYALATTGTNNLRTVFTSIEGETVRLVDRGDRTVSYQLAATSFTDPSLATIRPVETVDRAALTAVIGSDGLIRSYRLTYTGTIDNRTITSIETVRYTAIGTTVVRRPAWVDRLEGPNRIARPTGRVNARGTAGGHTASSHRPRPSSAVARRQARSGDPVRPGPPNECRPRYHQRGSFSIGGDGNR